jgi:hypothetical protein
MTPGGEDAAAERQAYDELQCYTLAHGGREFIHQHVVDAWMAQHADQRTRPVGLTFALVGLFLHLERGFTGRQVQLAHMALGRQSRAWPAFGLPADRGAVTARDVLAASPGPERDRMIDEWCASVWAAFHDQRPAVEALLIRHGIVPGGSHA